MNLTQKIFNSSLCPPTARIKGGVLIIVLFFIVLLSGLVIAFFSRAVFERQVSNNSVNTIKVDLFVRSAADAIVCDLKQEIAAGSTALPVSGSSTTSVYAPLSNQTAIPYRMSTSGTLANLVKQSAYNQPFYSGSNYDLANYPAPNRAANIPTTTPSRNHRVISLPRWNKPLLLPKANPTSSSDQTPNNNTFAVPDWVLVECSGTNSQRANTNVVGRYAYTVYDEGGLLDINVAGYPGSMPAILTDSKDALAFADLTKLGLTQTQIDLIVGWRNYATVQPSGSFPDFTIPSTSATNYYSAVQANSFMRVASTSLYNGQSDRIFSSRQELLNFIQNVGGSTQRAALQQAMQYLGTFSRDTNQPSYVPAHILDPSAPKIVRGDGGNNAFGGDSAINPAFLTIRSEAGAKRNDGSAAIEGEPLVKTRFALNRLAWITCKGPSANLTTTDTVFQETINALGWESTKAVAWLKRGTDDAVLRYFGLVWDSTNKCWTYTSHLTSTHISTLSDVAAAKREPDFVELIKASINAGAIAKGATRYLATPTPPMEGASGIAGAQAWEDYQFRQDISLDAQVLQIAANIIDQSDVDGYPTRIYFNDGTTIGTREIVGVENLPYFYRIRSGIVRAGLPSPAGTYLPPTPGKYYTADPVLYYSGTGTQPANSSTLTDTGLLVYLLQPELWNPHDQNNPRAATSALAPTAFRFVADSTSPDLIGTGTASYPTISISTQASGNYDPFSYGAAAGESSWRSNTLSVLPFDNSYKSYPTSLTSDNSELNFTITGKTSNLFTEPTFLIHPDIPAGSNLKLGQKHSLRVFSNPPLNAIFAKLTQAVTSGSGEGIKCVQDNNTYIGLYLAVGPQRWVAEIPTPNLYPTPTTSGTYIVSAQSMSAKAWTTGWDNGITFRVQCQDPFGNWVTYDQKYSQEGLTPLVVSCNGSTMADWVSNKIGLIGDRGFSSCIDPRTSRFGMQGGNGCLTAVPGSITTPPSEFPAPLNLAQGITYSNRWDANPGAYMLYNSSSYFAYGLPGATGWYPKTVGAYWNAGTKFYYGLFAQNGADRTQYYADADGVVRRAMGAYSAETTTGQPLATANSASGNPTTQSQSRPIILNRPFRTVAELGYVFSGTPWKNLDMFTPESGFTGLLDVFCIADTDTLSGVVAGKVNLNTRQTAVLSAILAGAYRDEMSHYNPSPSGTLTDLTDSDADAIADAVVNRTHSTDTKKGPLCNLSDLVGRWTGAVADANGAIDGRQSYHGFSEDLPNTDAASNNISRMREASIRALASCGTTRVWNLMIDVIAQIGRYPKGETDLENFIVEGERRLWLHVAIDRYTGEVIDQSIEIVKE